MRAARAQTQRVNNHSVKRVLARDVAPELTPQFDQGGPCRIAEGAKVGGVDLSMAVELAEVHVERRRIQKGRQAPSQQPFKRCAMLMEVVEVILKAHGFTGNNAIIENSSHDSTALLLRGKALDEHIYSGRDRKCCAAAVVNDGIRFLGRRLRPLDAAAVEVGGMDERNGVRAGL